MTAPQNDFSERRLQQGGNSVQVLDGLFQGWHTTDKEYVGMSVRFPRTEGDDYLATLRALDSDGQPIVCFHGAYNLLELLIGLRKRIDAGTLKWKPDEWGR